MKRRTRRWLIGALVLAAMVAGGVVFYRTLIDPSHAKAEYYPDTGLSPAERSPQVWNHVERPGTVCLAVERGKPHGVISTEHESWHRIDVEFPRPAAGDRIDLNAPDVRVLFSVYDGRCFWKLRAGGVRGHLEIKNVSDHRITATYPLWWPRTAKCFFPVPEPRICSRPCVCPAPATGRHGCAGERKARNARTDFNLLRPPVNS